jgi:tetratricopeptide (TPR) repeat protein
VPDFRWLPRLEAEHDNLRAALSWALTSDGTLAVRLAGALFWFWELRGYLSEGRAWLGRALAAGAGAPPALRAKALLAAGDFAEFQQDFRAAEAALTEALGLWHEVGDRRGAARTLRSLGHVAVDQRDFVMATERYTESIALWRELGDEQGAAIVRVGLGTVAFYQGNYERATALWTEAAAHFRASGDKRRLGVLLNNLGSLDWEKGELDRAVRIHEEALAIARELGDEPGIAASLTNLGMALELRGDQARAWALLEEAMQRYRDLGILGEIAAPLYHLAWLARAQNNMSLATRLAREALAAAHATPGTLWVGQVMELVAALAADQGRAEQGARLLSTVIALPRTIGQPPSVPERVYQERVATAVWRRLSEEAVAAHLAADNTMSLDEAVATATALAAELATARHSLCN